VARQIAGQARPHLGAKNIKPQSLRLAYFVLMLCPSDFNSAFGATRQEINSTVGLRRMK
jgi:hypothetical protein